jgi:hypothetical protein
VKPAAKAIGAAEAGTSPALASARLCSPRLPDLDMLASMKPKTMSHISVAKWLLIILAGLSFVGPIYAQERVVYTAFLSERDHYNSNGERLTSVADILRQDRANYYKGGGDRRDEDDGGFFATTESRAKFEYYTIILGNVRAAAIIQGAQRSVVVRVVGRRIYVEGVE